MLYTLTATNANGGTTTSVAQVTVRFVSEQINVVRSAEGQIAEGNPNEVQKVVDLWAFRRDTKSGDPNWQLVKTESEG